MNGEIPAPGGDQRSPRRPPALLLALALALLTLVAYLPALDNGFVGYDDDLYVTANPWVQRGITVAGLRWASTAVVAENWHPLTLLSHMADCELYGLAPRGHHLTSVLLHVANVLLLFAFLRRATGDRTGWKSAATAALFAVHPTHVESVAWVAERKDVLSGFFFFLALLAYVRYAERPSAGRYLTVAAALALGLAAKPMLVTLPLLLLLLDVWPLGRLPLPMRWSALRPLILEKLPLLALSAGASALTLRAQKGALAPAEALPLGARLANALVSYVAYLGKTLWPQDLAVFYPLPPSWPVWQVAGAATLLAALTAGVLLLARRAPYLAVGWLWYLGLLVPVIGLLQVGGQARADRYTYLPTVGLFVAMCWGLPALARGFPPLRRLLPAAALAGMLLLGIFCRIQTSYWRDTFTLFGHAAEVTPGNYVAHLNLAEAWREAGRPAEALQHYRAAIAARPGFAQPQAALGAALRGWGRPAEALGPLRTALALDPGDARAHATLAMALDDVGRSEEAIAELRRALELDPGLSNARRGLAVLLSARPPREGSTGGNEKEP